MSGIRLSQRMGSVFASDVDTVLLWGCNVHVLARENLADSINKFSSRPQTRPYTPNPRLSPVPQFLGRDERVGWSPRG